MKEGAGLGVHRAVGVGVELAYSVACEGKRLLTLGKGAGRVVLRCRLHRKALVWVDWQIACGLGCSGSVAIRVAKRGLGGISICVHSTREA